MRNRHILLILAISFILTSCGIFKTHHKKELIDFENNLISSQSIKFQGYYFTELEWEYGEYPPYPIDEYYKKTGIKKIKHLSIFFIYEDGFVLNISGINGLSHYYCARKEAYENTYESAHKTIELMLESQNSEIKQIKRNCRFRPDDINNKGLAKINGDSIKIQFYRIESQNPGKDSFNSAYLHEINGIIKNDSSFVIKSKTQFRYNKTKSENRLFKFRQTKQKPNIENYFKKRKNQFK
ncbi:hypothetical protein [Aquimarina sp. 2201CG14-23]|uniref:hypothetical protein n=1 Tax=Aquimarina mycalae TaxID=3040073 RepID=UPI002477D80A|nr:hypothetical protein [Aquimarina sp. 2201CG14-23]MDH7445971.1 hypothetical protein [Aquimarina sp. 2201CG14-23]